MENNKTKTIKSNLAKLIAYKSNHEFASIKKST